ncbi:hypothetical protein DEU56DRAFT_979442 [Suillus clintonianus]|uniref:uncharacterized protein n=1 Tax=Suillus clintonianus TaxID=1904413 RepID=UPI001B85E4F1|nr:uncharacterized protein DEU56DRAFT_979442 [Suillus clintonianus]KAG2143002.1 hypothetical protein DEU56DRAFT_979442 [Suillus clintonianus]
MSSSTSASSTPSDIRPSSGSSLSGAVASYSLGFLLVSVVILLIIVGCCFGRWRRRALLGDSDTTEQLYGMGGGRRKLIPPVFWDTWLSRPPASTEQVLMAGQSEWSRIQPVSVSLIRAYHSRAACQPAVGVFESAAPAADPFTATWLLPDNSQYSSSQPSPPRRRFAFPLFHSSNFRLWPRRRSRTHHRSSLSEKPTGDETENHPEAVRIAVMISMPSSALRRWNQGEGSSCHSAGPVDALREYQIGVAQVPWTHGEPPNVSDVPLGFFFSRRNGLLPENTSFRFLQKLDWQEDKLKRSSKRNPDARVRWHTASRILQQQINVFPRLFWTILRLKESDLDGRKAVVPSISLIPVSWKKRHRAHARLTSLAWKFVLFQSSEDCQT